LSLKTINDQQRTCFILFDAFMPPVKDGLKKQWVSAIPDGPAAVVAANEAMGIRAGFTSSDFCDGVFTEAPCLIEGARGTTP
jgi:hypothetical protein